MLLENNSIKTNEIEIATIMNDYFINNIKNLNLKSSKKCTAKDLNSIVSEFDDHISIKKIKEFFPDINVNDFEFETVTMEDVKKEILNLNTKKSSTSGSIPATILKQSLDIYLPYLTKSVNYTINESEFPAELKHSEVIPLLKKEDPLKKENYRPASLLPHLSKVFERIIYKQINEYMGKKTFKIYNRFQKIAWNSTFYGNHARKMEKSSRQKRTSAFYLWIYQRPFIQSITIFCWQSYMHMVSL